MKLFGVFILVFTLGVAVVANQGSDYSTSYQYPFQGDGFGYVMPSGDGQYHPLHFTKDDLYYMTEAIYFEAATEPEECQMLVAEVILNRKADSRWNGTVKGVIWAKYQFSYTHDGKHEIMLDLDARKRIEAVAIKVLGGNVVDKSEGSLYYYNPNLANPDWDWSKIEKVMSCGHHDFYKDKQTKGDF